MGPGGAERVAANLSNDWVRSGYSVTLILTYQSATDPHYFLDERVQIIKIAEHLPSNNIIVFSKIRKLIAIRRLTKQLSPKKVISFMVNVNVLVLLSNLGLGCSTFVSERVHPSATPVRRIEKILRWLLYPFAHTVIVQTNASMLWFERHLPHARYKVIGNPLVFPIPNKLKGIDFEISNHSERKIILAVGRLERQKGFQNLINAFSKISKKHTDFDLLIAGEGTQRQTLEKTINVLNLADRVHLPGSVSNIGECYLSADIFVLSSEFEGYPNALLEAMACGLPVISFDCPTGPAEIIDDGNNGILVPLIAGENGLVEALLRVIENNNLRKKLRRNAPRVLDTLGLKENLDEWNQLISF